jgi:hypothetical protein
MRTLAIAVLAIVVFVFMPAALAENGCAAFYMPPGPMGSETGNFITGVWNAHGTAFLAHQAFSVSIVFQDSFTSVLLGKKGNTMHGEEKGTYDFGNGDTFKTAVNYVSQHMNELDKWHISAVEVIVPGSGTGRFLGATGTLTDHGPAGVSIYPEGWASFTKHGTICGPYLGVI